MSVAFCRATSALVCTTRAWLTSLRPRGTERLSLMVGRGAGLETWVVGGTARRSPSSRLTDSPSQPRLLSVFFGVSKRYKTPSRSTDPQVPGQVARVSGSNQQPDPGSPRVDGLSSSPPLLPGLPPPLSPSRLVPANAHVHMTRLLPLSTLQDNRASYFSLVGSWFTSSLETLSVTVSGLLPTHQTVEKATSRSSLYPTYH